MKFAALLLGLCFSVSVCAQDYDFGKVSKEELEEKINPLDSSANATYLYKYRRTFFEYTQEVGFEVVTEVQERIKIYTQEGFDYATKKLNLYKSGQNEEKFSNLKAYTYNLVNGKIENDKIGKEGIFVTELHKYSNQVKFTMPNIKPGCIVEYKYTITSPFISNVDEFVFQHDIPIKKLEAKFEAPEYFSFKANTKGFIYVTPITAEKRDKITFTTKTREGFYVNKTSFNISDVEFMKKMATYNLSNIPALKEEPYVNSIDNYRSAVKYELSYTKFPETPIEYYSTTWEDVVKKIYESPSFGDELKKTGYFEEDITALINTISDPVQRAAIIFNFVKTKVKWNGYYGYYTNDGVKRAYKDQVGNAAEINLMLTSMLRYAGLDAFPVLVSARQNGVPLFPTREGYNYVVSYVKLPEGTILLDATNKYCTPNTLPFRALNWQGRVIAEHGGSQLINLYPKETSKNNVSVMVDLDVNGTISGNYRAVKTNHNALLYREEYNDVNKEDFLEKLENKYKNMDISDFEVTNDADLSKPVMESYKFVNDNQLDIIGDKMYFSPLFFLKTSENPFKLEKREFPVDFGYPSYSKYLVVVNLPAGYKIESVPKPSAILLPDNLGSYKYKIQQADNKIQVLIDTEISEPLLSPIYYHALKAYFSKIIEKESEQIVLTKI